MLQGIINYYEVIIGYYGVIPGYPGYYGLIQVIRGFCRTVQSDVMYLPY